MEILYYFKINIDFHESDSITAFDNVSYIYLFFKKKKKSNKFNFRNWKL